MLLLLPVVLQHFFASVVLHLEVALQWGYAATAPPAVHDAPDAAGCSSIMTIVL
jgi:hypothetical protein